MKALSTGTELANGAKVLMSSQVVLAHDGFVTHCKVLALFGNKFVIWTVRIDDLAASSGTYYTDLAEAVRDFASFSVSV